MDNLNEEFSPQAKFVECLDSYKLLITFENDEKRIFDFKPFLQFDVYRGLQYENFFKRALVKHGVVQWSDMVDLDPDRAYMDSIPLEDL